VNKDLNLLIIILLCANFNAYLPFGDEIMTERTIVDFMEILFAKKDHGMLTQT